MQKQIPCEICLDIINEPIHSNLFKLENGNRLMNVCQECYEKVKGGLHETN